jgi:hypothetical protein
MDSRPRNDHGQFAPEVQGELDANNTSAAYNPQIIENRKATLGEKLRRAIGLRGGVEQSVPERVLSRFNHGEHGAKLKELAQLRWENSPDFNSSEGDSALGRAGSLVAAAGAGVAANAAGVFGAKKIINIKPSPAPWARQERSYNNRVLDKFAFKKGYVPANHSDMGISESSMPAAVLQFKQPVGGKKGVFLRGKNTPDFVRAHEAGHVAQNLTKRGLFGLAGQHTASKYAPLGLLSAVVNKDKKYDNVATGMAAAGTLASLPTMHNEIDASVRGYKIMRKLGSSRLRASGAFIGVPTYGALAALPAMGWGARKLRQAKAEKSKQLSSKLNHGEHGEHGGVKEFCLRELAEYNPSNEALQLRAASLAYNKFIESKKDWMAASNSEKGLGLMGRVSIANNAMQKKGIQSQWHLPFGIGKKAKAWRQYNQDMNWVNTSLSAKLRLRELARQAAYDPYSGQTQPAAGDAGKGFRNSALGIGALGVGGGAAYLGWRGGQASKSVQGAADSAKAATESAKAAADEVQKAARSGRKLATRVGAVMKGVKTQLTTFPTFKKVASKF